MRKRTDGILRGQFREIILTDRKTRHVRGIFWARTAYRARYFARNMRYLGLAARIRRMEGRPDDQDKHINYILLNWREA